MIIVGMIVLFGERIIMELLKGKLRIIILLALIVSMASIALAALVKEEQVTIVHVKGVVIESPTDADRLLLIRANKGLTVKRIQCICDPANTGESVVIALYESDTSGDFTDLATNGLDGATTITCDNDGATDDGSLSNSSIDTDDWIGIDVGTITGTVSTLIVTFNYQLAPQ